MWIFTNKGMLSIVAHRAKLGDLLVRAREPGTIEAVFPEAIVTKTPQADYLYRATLARDLVGERISLHLESLQYSNFKNSIPDDEAGQIRHDYFSLVWQNQVEHQAVRDGRVLRAEELVKEADLWEDQDPQNVLY